MKFNFVIPKEKSMALLYMLNGTLMGMHCIFLVFFALNHVTVMTVVNIFSIITYLCNFIVLRKQFLRASSIIVFVEIIVHMFLTILCVGTGSGFQQYYIGCAAVIFFMEYFIQRLEKQPANSLLLCAIDGVCYLTSVYLSWTRGARYTLKPLPTMAMQLFNLFVVFVFISIFLLAIMVKTASFYEGELTRQAEHDRLTGMYNRALRDFQNYFHAVQKAGILPVGRRGIPDSWSCRQRSGSRAEGGKRTAGNAAPGSGTPFFRLPEPAAGSNNHTGNAGV